MTAAGDLGSAALLETIHSVASSRVLVLGALPPEGRDIDLVVSPADSVAITSTLRADGFAIWHGRWIRCRKCSVCVVDIGLVDEMRLPAVESEAVFAEGVPLRGLRNVIEPAPHHELLILARKLARRRRSLTPKHRARVDRALATDPAAWQKARARAALWRAEGALRRLEARLQRDGAAAVALQALPRRPRRTRVVALSGAALAARVAQADFLRTTLDRLGLDAVVERPSRLASGSALGAALSLWGAILPHLGRGRIVICDGYALDAAVSFASPAPRAEMMTVRKRLLRLVAPTASSYLLDAEPDADGAGEHRPAVVESYRREADAFGALRLDAGQPACRLCTEIAMDVLRKLEQRTKMRALIRAAR